MYFLTINKKFTCKIQPLFVYNQGRYNLMERSKYDIKDYRYKSKVN